MEYSLIATEPDGSKWVMIEESESIIATLKEELEAKENIIKSKNKLIEKLVDRCLELTQNIDGIDNSPVDSVAYYKQHKKINSLKYRQIAEDEE